MLEMSLGGTAPSHRSANVDANVRADMDRVKQARNFNTKAHKDPFEQAVIYNANNDVYELFKVSNYCLDALLALVIDTFQTIGHLTSLN